MATIAKLVTELSLDDRMTGPLESTMKRVEAIGAKIRTIGLGMTAAVTLPILAVGKSMLTAASDLNEAQSATMQVYGDGAQQVITWSEQAATAVGLSQEQYLSNMTVLGVYGDMLGLTGAETAAFSNELVTAAADLGSFYNANTPDVLAAMQSALRGEFDPLEQYGILLNQATLEAYAMEQGIWDGSNAMTNQQKVMATQGYILDNLGAAQGDFARTSGGLANTSKILRAQLADLSAEMGKVLLPAAVAVAGKLRDLLARFRDLSPGVQKWIVLIGLAVAAIGPLLIVLGTLLTLLPAIGTALAVLAGPVGLVLGLIALLGAAYLKNWFGFADAVNGAVKAGGKFVKTLKQQYDFYRKLGKTPIEAGFSALGVVLENLTGINLNEWFARIGNAFQRPLDAINKLKNAISAGNWRMAIAAFGDLLSAPAKLIGDFFKGIETGFKPLDRVFRELGNLVTGFGRLIQEVFQGDWGGALDVAQGMLGNFRDLLGNVVDLAGNLGSRALDWALDIGVPTVTGWILDGAQSLWDWLTGLYPKLKDLAGEILDWGIDVAVPAVTGAIVDAFTSAWDWVTGKVSWLADTITGAVESFDISIPIPGIVGDIVNAFGSVWDWIRSKIGWLVGVIGAGGEADKTLTKAVSSFDISLPIPAIVGDIVNAFGSVWDWIRSKVGWLVGVISAGGEASKTLETSVGAFEISIPVPAIVGAIIDAFATVWDWIEGGVGWLAGFLSSDDALTKTVSGFDIDIPTPTITGEIVDAFTSMWEAAKSVATWLVDTFEQTVTANISITGAFSVVDGMLGWFQDALGKALGWAWDGLQWVYKTVVKVEAEAQPRIIAYNNGEPSFPETMINTERDFDAIGAYPNADLPAAQPIEIPAVNRTLFDSSIEAVKRTIETYDTPAPAPVNVPAPELGLFISSMASVPIITGQAMSDALSAASTYTTAIVTVAGTNAAQLAAVMTSAFNQVVSTASSTMSRIPGIVASALGSAAAMAYSSGLAIGQGLAAGMNASLAAVTAAANALAAEATRAAQAQLQVASPSRVFMRIGENVGEGLAIGMRNELGTIASASGALAGAANSGWQNRMAFGWLADGGGAGGYGESWANNGVININADDPEGFWDALRRQGLAGARR